MSRPEWLQSPYRIELSRDSTSPSVHKFSQIETLERHKPQITYTVHIWKPSWGNKNGDKCGRQRGSANHSTNPGRRQEGKQSWETRPGQKCWRSASPGRRNGNKAGEFLFPIFDMKKVPGRSARHVVPHSGAHPWLSSQGSTNGQGLGARCHLN